MNGISFREDFHLWWPDYDHNPVACHSKVMRRVSDADMCLKYRKGDRVVVQAGGHAGVWPLRLVQHFQQVYTFEPDQYLYRCLVRNVKEHPRIITYNTALGAKFDVAKLALHASAGSATIAENGETIVMQTIDDLRLPACDAIILDVEGYEVEVLKGAMRTIEKFWPVIHLELSHPEEQQAFLHPLGYRGKWRLHSDMLYVHGVK